MSKTISKSNNWCLIFHVFGISILLTAFCIASSSSADCGKSQQPQKSCEPNGGPAYDCAASSLFGLCNKSDINLSYEDCLHLLPKSPKGNSMLEYKQALEHIGFFVRAEWLTAGDLGDVKVPCVLLLSLPKNDSNVQSSKNVGHYIVLRPIEENKFEILDYPRPSVIIPKEYLFRHLQTVGINDVPVLFCYKHNLRR
jgi:hypothetical protein